MICSTSLAAFSNVIYFDVETTGFDPKEDRIIELACVKVSADGSTEEFDSFIRPDDGREIPEKITQITGITGLDVYAGNSISEEEMITRFTELMKNGKTLLVAHNAQFDLNFIAETMIRHKSKEGLAAFCSADYLDTLTVYKDRAGYPHKLENAIVHYGLQGEVKNSHRAIDDTKALAAVAEKMAQERDDLSCYVNVFGFNSKYGVSGRTLKKVTYVPQGTGYGMISEDRILPKRLKEDA